jgi:hypothetical protein
MLEKKFSLLKVYFFANSQKQVFFPDQREHSIPQQFALIGRRKKLFL